jgi:formylglycine-generating enzyme required for sulfatase activity
MLRITGGVRGQYLLVGLLLFSISVAFPTLAEPKRLPIPGRDGEPAPRRVTEKVTRFLQQPFEYGMLGAAKLPLVPSVAPSNWSATEREWSPPSKDIIHSRLIKIFKEKHKANSAYARLAEARIEGLQKQRPASIIQKIPTIQLLDCTTLTEEDVCKGLMCTWEAARCQEATASAGPTATSKPLSIAEERALKPGDHFKECDDCPEIVVIPAGSFMMGSPANERQRSSSETQVRVAIAEPFAVAKYAVTFDEWDACIADGGCNGYRPTDQGWGRGKHPVINVSWDDAKAYAAWVAQKTGKTYRLLSDAEREYVTRASTTTPFCWGSSIQTTQANYNGDHAYEGGAKGRYRQKTMPVDSFVPNAWGLYQVHGNVWEWTEDCWNDSNDTNPADGSARTVGDCSRRVARGGSWDSFPQSLRSADRSGIIAASQRFDLGFRLARTLKQ